MTTLTDAQRGFVAGMPKIELHVHLEGATPPQTVLKLAGILRQRYFHKLELKF
jgi:adenosine deaminase